MKQPKLIQLLKHPMWDLFALVGIIGAYVGSSLEENWIAGVAGVIWFGTILVRWTFPD